MNQLTVLFGHFHPVLVHLPIGFLLLALVLQWLVRKEKYAQILPAVRIAFLLGMISAVLACLTGLSLSAGGEYDESILAFHKWSGISVALVSLTGYLLSAKPLSAWQQIFSILTLILVVITGHLGGTLTHGEGYLTKGFLKKTDSSQYAKKPITHIQDAIVYADIIQPILQDKCSGCHSSVKQKGGLRLDAKEWIVKGGKDGQVFVQGNANSSELYKRVLLDPLEEKHMPPKGKRQLTEQEINLLHWWINSDAGFDKKVNAVAQPPQIMAALLALQTKQVVTKPSVPVTEVEKISESILDSLRKAGIVVLPVAVNSHYLQASFVSIPKPGDKEAALLQLIKKQLVWLQLPAAYLSPASWKIVGNCGNLIRLSIEHSNIADATLPSLGSLAQLQYLNLVDTRVTVKGIQPLKNLSALEHLYLAQTAVTRNDIGVMQKLFPKVMIDFGNYQVENLAVDTQLVKAPPVK